MGFIGVYTSIYDYHPQAQGELELREGDLLYVLEKSDEDDWWRAKKKADRDDEDEPEGLVPNNYVEEVRAPLQVLLRSGDGKKHLQWQPVPCMKLLGNLSTSQGFMKTR